jgi:hypothetical protein
MQTPATLRCTPTSFASERTLAERKSRRFRLSRGGCDPEGPRWGRAGHLGALGITYSAGFYRIYTHLDPFPYEYIKTCSITLP